MPRKPNIAAIAQESYDGAQDSRAALDSITTEVGRLLNIPASSIRSNPHQPRKNFDEKGLQELASSIKEHGILHPIAVCKNGDGYELIAGERRLRAAKIAGIRELPAYVRENVKTAELAIVENVQREDLHPLELAEGLQKLKDLHNYTNDVLGSVLGKSKQTVSEILSLNDLPQDIKEQYRSTDVRTLPKSLILQVLRADNPQKMWQAYRTGQITTVREARKTAKPQKGRPAKRRFPYKTKSGWSIIAVAPGSRATIADAKKALQEAARNLK